MKNYLIAMTLFMSLIVVKGGFADTVLLCASARSNIDASVVSKKTEHKIIIEEKGIKRLPDVINRRIKLKSVSIPVKLINSSNDTLKYMSWSCSWWDIYKTDKAGVLIADAPCEYNAPIIMSLAPHKAAVINVPILYNKSLTEKNLKIKIGMYLQTNISTTLKQMIDKKERDKLIWSNMVTIKNQ